MHRRQFLTAAAALGGLAVVGQAKAAPATVGTLVTRWDTDPWSLGSYSALPVGTQYWVREELSKALIGGRVVLAGEYCDPDHPATVHGAYASGQRAALHLIAKVGSARSVVVVGAGIAGLRAAEVLRQSGRTVTVLEARGRVGGRIHTDHSLGVPSEMGAAWVHGVTGNPMVELVRRAGLGLVRTHYDDSVTRTMHGATVSTTKAENRIWRNMQWIGRHRPGVGASVAAALARRGWNDSSAKRRLVQTVEIDYEFGVSAGQLGAQALWEGKYQRGGDKLVQGGFSKVPQMLANGLDVRLDAPVSQVGIQGKSVTAGPVRADAAVVAVPLPLLQTGMPALAMPTYVRTAVDGLITGNLEKVFLKYPRAWWPDHDVLQVLRAPHDRWAEWYNLVGLVGAPVIFGFAGGAQARRRPTSDGAAAGQARRVLERAFG